MIRDIWLPDPTATAYIIRFKQDFDTANPVEAKARTGPKNLADYMRRAVQLERLATVAPP